MISAILCTHNPRIEYLRRTLHALAHQNLPLEEWELLVVDNVCEPPIAKLIDLGWHPRARIVREDALGLTAARLRGIRESVEELIVFVDDDNVLAGNYLSVAKEIAQAWPMLGAWGGNILPEFESAPEAWSQPYLRLLALRQVPRPTWGNSLYFSNHTPWGAGLCVRRSVAEGYYRAVAADPRRRALDRRGNSLASAGDVDMAYTAIDQGLGIGVFPDLSLTHLIPANRVREDYLARLQEANAHSAVWLSYFRGEVPSPATPRPPLGRIMDFLRVHRLGRRARRFFEARERGHRLAVDEVIAWNSMNLNGAAKAADAPEQGTHAGLTRRQEPEK